MPTWKLVLGIMSICFSMIMFAQSYAASVENALSGGIEAVAVAGAICAILTLIGGIVSIATREATTKNADKSLITIFLIVAIIGAVCYGEYGDLVIWSVWAVVNIIISYRSMRKIGKMEM